MNCHVVAFSSWYFYMDFYLLDILASAFLWWDKYTLTSIGKVLNRL